MALNAKCLHHYLFTFCAYLQITDKTEIAHAIYSITDAIYQLIINQKLILNLV